jgi:hypothetical protein
MPVTPRQSLPQAFALALAENPRQLFTSGAMNVAGQARLDKFPAPGYGASVTRLNPMEGRAISDIKEELLANGFREVAPATPNLRMPPDMEIFMHEDGGLVKIKPNGDDVQFSRFGRAGPMASREVVIDPTMTGEAVTGFDNVAFKVTETGLPIPKLPGHLNRPVKVSLDDEAMEAFDKAWADLGHARPAASASFTQRIPHP